MGNGISLEQARIQLNMPYASEAEVRTAAQANNLVIIDFGGSNNPSSVTIGSDITLFGGAQSSSVSGDDIYGGMVSFGNTNPTAQTSTVGQSNNPSSASQTGQTPQANDALEQRTNEILRQIYGDQEIRVQSKEVKDSKQRVVMEDGTVIEIPLKEGEEGYDPSKVRSDVQYKIFKNGNVTVKNADGTETTRKAVNGEEGYVKDGESFDERLARFYSGAYKNGEPSIEKKKELARKYVAGYLAGKTDATQIGDFKKLLRNTPPDSEMGRVLVTLAAELNDSVINQAIEEVYGTRLTDEAVSAVTDELTNGGIIAGIQNEEVQARAYEMASGHVVDENNARALAGTSTQLIAGNQADAVRVGYENIADPKLRAAYRDEATNRIAEYDKDAVIDITQIHIENDDEDHTGAKNMAGHGHELDASVQKEFVRLLTAIGNEDVSTIIAENAYNYDLTNRDDIIKMLQEQGYDKTLSALENARKEYEAKAAQDQANAEARRAEAQRQQEQQAQAANNNSTPTAGKVYSSSELKSMAKEEGWDYAFKNFKGLKSQDIADVFADLEGAERQEIIGEYVEQASEYQLQNLMTSSLRNDILSYLVKHNTGDNKRKLEALQKSLTTVSDRMELEDLQRDNAPTHDTSPGTGDGNSNNNPFKFGFITRH